MKACACRSNGAIGMGWHVDRLSSGRRIFQGGFTLLEMCIVLFVIALLLGLTMPAMQSTFVEQAVRNDATQLSLMVKTAMLQSIDQHRPYVIDFEGQSMTLHPATDAATSAKGEDDSEASDDGVVSWSLNGSNKLFLPDPDKPKGWLHVKSDSWFFKPGELCPAPRVRLVRGNAWLEMSFNALTGNVENETAYFP